MALFRALETARPPHRRLFSDPYAARFLRPPLKLAVRAARLPLVGELVPWFIDRHWAGARTSGVGRTCFIDDVIRQRLDQELEQLVLLGAGFDSRALRLPGIESVRVFELDRAATLEHKRARLGALPPHIKHVPIDFNRESMKDVLERVGFERGRRTLTVWEGVTNYLTDAAVDHTLREVARLGGELVFTYVHLDTIRNPQVFVEGRRVRSKVASSGEPWTFGLDPGELEAYLAARGLELVEDVGSLEYRARYLGESRRTLRGFAFYRVAMAREGAVVAARH